MRPVYDVVVLGAGISGIGAGIRLLHADIDNFVILEKAADLGGTWRDNTYPGCECDVPSALYSYSFAQNPNWTRTFAGQAEILDYVRHTAERYQISGFIRFNQTVAKARWLDDQCIWVVNTQDQVYYARTLISCCGYLHEPILPDLPGLNEFSGHLFHSSVWDHQYELAGKRVAVIGTGASAIQFVPQIQPKVKHLTLFQRTPQWILPKPNHKVTSLEKKAFNNSLLLKTWRHMLFNGFESFGLGFRRPSLLKQVEKLARLNLAYGVSDEALRRKLTPDYALGCKRVLMSNDYYPALTQPNVSLNATAVKAVEGNTVIGQDESRAEVDTIILGTGFYVTEQPIAKRIFDGQGQSLAERWKNGMQAYRGTTIHGLPNAFMVLGPNLGIGHNSAFIVIEAQLNYIINALTTMRTQGLKKIEVKQMQQQRYNEKVQLDLQTTVWNTGGCSSYYLDKNGFNSVGFPWSTYKMRSLLKTFDLENYHTQADSEAASQWGVAQ